MVGKTKTGAKSATTVRAEPDAAEAPAKSAKTVRPKSPSRKSVGRGKSPGRPRNSVAPAKPAASSPPPARKRSPARRSPARTTSKASKSDSEEEKKRPVRAKKQKIVIVDEDENDSDMDFIEIKEKPKAAVRGRSRRTEVEQVLEDTPKETVEDTLGLYKRVTRSQNREVEHVVHLRSFETVTKKLGEFSDEDDIGYTTKLPESSSSAGKHTAEFGGTIGTSMLTLLLPAFVIGLYVVCDATQCSFTKVPSLKKYKTLQNWIELKTFLIYTAYEILMLGLSAMPFGGRHVVGLPCKQGKLEYCTNSLFIFTVFLTIFFGLELRGIPAADFLTQNMFQLVICSVIFGIIKSIVAYVRSFYAPISALNPHTCGKGRVYSFFMGREVYPRLGQVLDWKMYGLMSCHISMLLLDVVYAYKSLGLKLYQSPVANATNGGATFDLSSVNLDATVLVYFAMHSVYLMDGIWNEAAWLSSFEVQQEGYGYALAVGYNVWPFVYAATIRYLVQFGVKLAVWKLVIVSVVFLLGYVLYRASNSQKNTFRKNPYSPAVAHLETIPTTTGKKLLVSGFWGLVRHPNYLGDCIMHCCFGLFAWFAPPVIVALTTVILLVHRAVRDNARCKARYGAAWDRYCQRVRYTLVPKVY